MPETKPSAAEVTRSKEEFSKASQEVQELIRRILQEERQVIHMRTRPEIHKHILDHVKRLIK